MFSMHLLNSASLHKSSVVANCTMNRERLLRGAGGYNHELGIDVLDFLQKKCSAGPATWVDFCCGTGRALIEAAAQLQPLKTEHPIRIEGIDLAGIFDPNPFPDLLDLREHPLEAWAPAGLYALITCVHGLHYIGDKLAAIANAVRHLAPSGLFIANLDLGNFRFSDGKPAGRYIASRLRKEGLTYDTRRRRLRCEGPRQVEFGLRYLGANDAAGPNYTGQSAVDSYYEIGRGDRI